MNRRVPSSISWARRSSIWRRTRRGAGKTDHLKRLPRCSPRSSRLYPRDCYNNALHLIELDLITSNAVRVAAAGGGPAPAGGCAAGLWPPPLRRHAGVSRARPVRRAAAARDQVPSAPPAGGAPGAAGRLRRRSGRPGGPAAHRPAPAPPAWRWGPARKDGCTGRGPAADLRPAAQRARGHRRRDGVQGRPPQRDGHRLRQPRPLRGRRRHARAVGRARHHLPGHAAARPGPRGRRPAALATPRWRASPTCTCTR